MQHKPPAEVTAGPDPTRFRRVSPDHPDRIAADTGYRESARSGRPISQRPAPGEVARIRAALMGDIPGRMGLTEEQLRAFARGELAREALPEPAQCMLRELVDRLGGGTMWPRKVAAILWGMHEQQRETVR